MTAKKADKNLCRMVTPMFRTSYPHLFKAQSPKEGDKKKFSITMLFPKDSDLMGTAPPEAPGQAGKPRSLKEAIKNAKLAEFGPKENWPDDLESPVTDGDDPKFKDSEGYKGHWVIKASSGEDQRPSVVDNQMVAIDNPAEIYPGCYARAYVYAYVWFYPNRQKPLKKGVGFILDHVQKMKDGKSFGAKKPVDQVFAPVQDLDSDTDSAADNDDEEDFK